MCVKLQKLEWLSGISVLVSPPLNTETDQWNPYQISVKINIPEVNLSFNLRMIKLILDYW